MRTKLVGLVASLVLLLPAVAARAETITVLSDYWYPYNGEPRAASEGYMIDLLRWIAKADGDTIDYRLLDWELALQRTEAGTGGDCVVGATEGDAPRHARASQPWGKSLNTLYGHVDRMPAIPNLEALRALRIGVVADYSYGDDIDALLAEEGVQVVRVQASRRAVPLMVMRLATKQVDVIIEDVNVATVALNEMQMEASIKPISIDFMESDDLFVACSPNARGRALIAKFDAGMARARAEGELQRILASYELKDWAEAANPE
jgi:polar amino acid transport system substrate-binding protein